MAKGFNGFGGGMNMNALMKQAQKMQKQMEEAQADLAAKTLEITSGGGAVKITISGTKELKGIVIDKDVVDPDDVEMLQDLILTAVNEAYRQAEEMYSAQIGKITGGVGLPGM